MHREATPRPDRRRPRAKTAGMIAAALGALWANPAAGQTPATARTAAAPATILSGNSPWRVLYSWNAPLVQMPEGVQERRLKGSRIGASDRPDFQFMALYPPPEWTRADFDDSGWTGRHFFLPYSNGEMDERAGGGAASCYLRQLTLRGKFTVTEPEKVAPLQLTITYRGGAGVYLNGREIARAHLPAGKIEPGSPAEMYPLKAYVKDDGSPWNWWGDRDVIGKEAYALRPRRLERLPIPAKLLRKGTNVLAVEIHAAPFPEVFAKPSAAPQWATCGLVSLALEAPGGEGIVPNVTRPRGMQVWNANVAEDLYDVDWGDPHERLRPVALTGARNSCATARLVVSSDSPIRRLRTEMSPLAGPGGRTIPSSAVQVRYGVFAGIGSQTGGTAYSGIPALDDDGLVSTAPEEVAVGKKTLAAGHPASGLVPGAVQPVYLTLRIPKDAAPGDYRARITLAAEGEKPADVPVELKVIDFALSDPAEFAYWCGMVQSPEGVACHYQVPLWSDRHWELIAKSLDWVAQVGSKVLFVPLAADTEYGNAQSMVLWIREGAGGYAHDFTAVEKYVDVALKHLGRPRFVVVGVWQPTDRNAGPRVSVKDPRTGKIENVEAPPHGTEESLAFWQPVLTKVHEILRQRGLDKAMLLGFASDAMPDKAAATVFHKILPDVGWQASRHWPTGTEHIPFEGGNKPVMYQSNVWGCGDVQDPATQRVFGWNHKYGVPGGLRTWLNRGVYDPDRLIHFRGMSENILLSGRPGQGQIGADFWPPPPPTAKGARVLNTLYSRFPKSENVGAGNKGITANQLLYPAPDAPVATVRFEMLREGIQECEARIFLERLLLEKPPRLGEDLARKVQDVLDERTRWQRLQGVAPEAYLSWPYSGWEARTAKLYQAAAEAQKALDAK